MLRRKDVNMLSGSIVNGLLTIAIPVMVANILASIYNIIDMTVLKIYDTDGGYSVGAVGTCGTLITLITALVIGVSSGTNVTVARHIGRKDEESVNQAVGTAMVFSVLSGLALMVIGIAFATPFLRLVNCPPRLLEGATLYFRLYFIGVPILMVNNFGSSLLRATGDSKRPMMFSALSGGIKVFLSFLFVGVFKLQVLGIGLATILSWTVSFALYLRALIKTDSIVKIYKEYLHIYMKELKEMLFLGIPAGLQSGLYSIANVIIVATVNTLGEDATTGLSIANQFDGILYQIATAPALAVMPYVSQNVGARNIKRATQSVVRGMMITVCLGATFGALSAIFSGPLSSIMSDNPEVIKYSQQKMVIVSSTYFICGINEILGASMRGLRKPIVATVCTMIYMCGIRFIWVYLVYPLFPANNQLTYLYLIWPIGWILSIITILCFYLPTIRKLKIQADIAKATSN